MHEETNLFMRLHIELCYIDGGFVCVCVCVCVCVLAHLPHRVKAQAQESEDWTSNRSHHHFQLNPLLPLN